jgi:hypothetical protein
LEAWQQISAQDKKWLDWLVAEDERKTLAFHQTAAFKAEATQDWFVARFHLQWLVDHDKEGVDDLKQRLAAAEAKLANAQDAANAPVQPALPNPPATETAR